MNALDVYKTYHALNLHFKSDQYDYFKYKGATKVNISSFEKLKAHEQNAFYSISQLKEPKTYLIGNFLFNDAKYVKQFNEENYLKYRSFLTNGTYLLEQDLHHLKSPLVSNFSIENDFDIPYIAKLLMEGKISLHTACIMHLLSSWADKCKSPFINDTIKQVTKSYRFFKVNESEVKGKLIERFRKG